MNRREATHQLLLSLPGIAYGSALMGAMTSCQATSDPVYQPSSMSSTQMSTLEAAVERIIPTTDTPGAREAGVAQYIDTVLAKALGEEDQEFILAGLDELNETSQRDFSKHYAELGEKDQFTLLKECQEQTKATGDRFFQLMKRLTIFGYYTSEIGASQELIYVHTAGSYEDRKLSEVGKNYY